MRTVRWDIHTLNFEGVNACAQQGHCFCLWGWHPEALASVFSSEGEMKTVLRGRAGFTPPIQVLSALSPHVMSYLWGFFVFSFVLSQEGRKAFSIFLLCLALTCLSTWSRRAAPPFRMERTAVRRLGGGVGGVRKEEEEYKGYSAEVLGGLLGNWNSLRLH